MVVFGGIYIDRYIFAYLDIMVYCARAEKIYSCQHQDLIFHNRTCKNVNP